MCKQALRELIKTSEYDALEVREEREEWNTEPGMKTCWDESNTWTKTSVLILLFPQTEIRETGREERCMKQIEAQSCQSTSKVSEMTEKPTKSMPKPALVNLEDLLTESSLLILFYQLYD